jgi:general L-amino acid transport system permease protein
VERRRREAACRRGSAEVGACMAVRVGALAVLHLRLVPIPERWRVDVFFAMLAIGIVWLLWLEAPRRDLGALYFFVVVPIVSYILLNGMRAIGLRTVDTSLWGGCWSPSWCPGSASCSRCRSASCSRSGGARTCRP